MNDRKNGLLLSGFLFLCVWLILFLVAVTETGGVKYNFAFAATLAALCGVVCMVCYFTLDFMERRKDASGIYNFEYYRLKRRTRKELEQAREDLQVNATGEQIAQGLTRCLGPSVAETIETMDAFNKKMLEELERGDNAKGVKP